MSRGIHLFLRRILASYCIYYKQQQDNTSLLSIMASSPLVKFEIGRVTKSVFESPYLGEAFLLGQSATGP
ncbi:MAG TPA: hypothetical protein VKA87_06085 [Nitrososphaeraceae archaeon]|nr:hypothetical protein [Nitrososphaeraceae archaeon]